MQLLRPTTSIRFVIRNGIRILQQCWTDDTAQKHVWNDVPILDEADGLPPMRKSPPLTFADLRDANLRRLPQFKNCHGDRANSEPDGSDWSPAQWVQAWIGEVGEFCTERIRFERGEVTADEYKVLAAKELPDSIIYQDILARHALNTVKRRAPLGLPGPADRLMKAMSLIGQYANARKKYERGDIGRVAFNVASRACLQPAIEELQCLRDGVFGDNAETDYVDTDGVDLDAAIRAKFNLTSDQVKSSVKL